MIGKLVCFFKGKHKRGRLTSVGNGIRRYACPRCLKTWERKARKAKA